MLYGLCCVFQMKTSQASEIEKKPNYNYFILFYFIGSGTQEKTKD